nr:PadR family transcriptional regulator [uncultured Lichenicoccus sp.]
MNSLPQHIHHWLHAIGPHRGRGGFGHGRGGFGRGGFMGGDGVPGGRKLGSAELQLVLLALLAEQPAHGYELIRMLEERSGGFYAPSPGMIYPALTYLEEIGHAAVAQDGNRKLYSLTDAGRAHLEANRDQATLILETLARIGGRMSQVREAFAGLDDADPRAADELHQARHAIKHALMHKRGCSPEEARRIAGILTRATAEILGKES